MTITYHRDLIQGSDEWLEARLGMLTASEVKLVLTPTLKVAANDKTRAHVWEIAAQRITRYVEPHYVSDDMLRGHEDEITVRALYAKHFAPVEEAGFVTNDRWGFVLGYSPDGLVGDAGLIEIKSRRQRFQVETIVRRGVPVDDWLQVQTALLVSERAWIDYVSFSGGLPMMTVRVEPDAETHAAIVAAATDFEARVVRAVEDYASSARELRLIPTKRQVDVEIW